MKYFDDEVLRIAALFGVYPEQIKHACNECTGPGEYPVFHGITPLGVGWIHVSYSKPYDLPKREQIAKHFNVSYLGIQPTTDTW